MHRSQPALSFSTQSTPLSLFQQPDAFQPVLAQSYFLTFDKQSNMSTLWRQKEFFKSCSEENLVEKAQEIVVTIAVHKN